MWKNILKKIIDFNSNNWFQKEKVRNIFNKLFFCLFSTQININVLKKNFFFDNPIYIDNILILIFRF